MGKDGGEGEEKKEEVKKKNNDLRGNAATANQLGRPVP